MPRSSAGELCGEHFFLYWTFSSWWNKGQVGRGSEQPDPFEDVHAHNREIGLGDL